MSPHVIVAVMSAVWLPGLASVKVAPDRTLLFAAFSVPPATAVVLPVRGASATVMLWLELVEAPPSSVTVTLKVALASASA